MKNLYQFILLISVLSFTSEGCKKLQPAVEIPQVPGSWSNINNKLNYDGILTTSTGLIGYGNNSAYFSSSGATWIQILGVSKFEDYSFQVDLMDNSKVVAYSKADSTLYVSPDGGQTWSVLNNHPAKLNERMHLLGINGNSMFAITKGHDILLKSDDLGNVWDTVAQNVHYYYSDYHHLSKLVTLNNSLFVITETTVYYSTDGGNHWSYQNQSQAELDYYAGITSNGNIYGCSQDLYCSIDTGRNWLHRNCSNFLCAIVFDTTLLIRSGSHLECINTKNNHSQSADTGLPKGGGLISIGEFQGSMCVNDKYVYLLLGRNSLYWRTKSDFSVF